MHMAERQSELHRKREKREVADLGPTPEQAHAWISVRYDLGYYHKLGHKKDGRPAGRKLPGGELQIPHPPRITPPSQAIA